MSIEVNMRIRNPFLTRMPELASSGDSSEDSAICNQSDLTSITWGRSGSTRRKALIVAPLKEKSCRSIKWPSYNIYQHLVIEQHLALSHIIHTWTSTQVRTRTHAQMHAHSNTTLYNTIQYNTKHILNTHACYSHVVHAHNIM